MTKTTKNVLLNLGFLLLIAVIEFALIKLLIPWAKSSVPDDQKELVEVIAWILNCVVIVLILIFHMVVHATIRVSEIKEDMIGELRDIRDTSRKAIEQAGSDSASAVRQSGGVVETKVKLIEDQVLSMLELQTNELNESLQSVVTDCLLSSPEAIHEGFHKATQHLIREDDPEMRAMATLFVRESLSSLIDNGFCIMRAEFREYQHRAIEFVRALYKSPDGESRIWTVCLPCPTQYLCRQMTGVDPDVGSHGANPKPTHLLSFDGVDANNFRPFASLSRRIMSRIVYLNDKHVHDLINCKSRDSLSHAELDQRAEITAFSYVWFLLYNRRIRLFWSWDQNLRDDMGESKDKAAPQDPREDFMIFDRKFIIRYDEANKLLLLCWMPSNLSPDKADKKWGLFEQVSARFDRMSKTFVELENGGSSRAGLVHDRNVHRTHPESLYKLFTANNLLGTDASRNRFREVMHSSLEKTSNGTNWKMPGGDAGQALSILTSRVLFPTLESLEPEKDDGYYKIEDRVLRQLEELSDDESAILYRFLEGPRFREGLKKVFPLLDRADLPSILVP